MDTSSFAEGLLKDILKIMYVKCNMLVRGCIGTTKVIRNSQTTLKFFKQLKCVTSKIVKVSVFFPLSLYLLMCFLPMLIYTVCAFGDADITDCYVHL